MTGAIVNLLSNQSILTNGFKYLNQNPVMEVAFLDATTMITPRTAMDYQQNPVYGTETLFRETAPMLFNPFGPGIVAWLMLATMHGGQYKGVHAGLDSIENMNKAWVNAGGENFLTKNTHEEKTQVVKDYFKEILLKTTGTINDQKKATITKEQLNELDQNGQSLLDKAAKLVLEDNKDKKAAKKTFHEVAALYTEKTGAAGSLAFKLEGVKNEVSNDIHGLLTDAVSLGKNVFTKSNFNEHVNNVKKLVPQKTNLGIGLSVAGIFSLPYINNTITKLRTGKSGYTAYKDFCTADDKSKCKKEDKTGLWAKKLLASAGMALLVAGTMGGFAKNGKGFFCKGGFKNFKDKIELKGSSAHMDLIKLVYGTALIGRFLFSRDEQELKVTTIRDYAGYLNWLVLGGFVAKGVAYAADKKRGAYVNIKAPVKGKNIFDTVRNWLSNVSVKTHSELEHYIKANNITGDAAKKMKAVHNGAMLSGLAYSMIALGLAMPAFCNYLTNKEREKQLKENAKCGFTSQPNQSVNNTLKIEPINNQDDNNRKLLISRVFAAQNPQYKEINS